MARDERLLEVRNSQDLLRYRSRGRKGSRRRELPYHPGRDAGSRWRVRLGKIGDEPVDHAVGSARPVRRCARFLQGEDLLKKTEREMQDVRGNEISMISRSR